MTSNKQGTEKCVGCQAKMPSGSAHAPDCNLSDFFKNFPPQGDTPEACVRCGVHHNKLEPCKNGTKITVFDTPDELEKELKNCFYSNDVDYTISFQDGSIHYLKPYQLRIKVENLIHWYNNSYKKLQQEAREEGYKNGYSDGIDIVQYETRESERSEIVEMVKSMQSVCEKTMQGDELEAISRICSAVIENITQRGK